jgi:hypothetical protein
MAPGEMAHDAKLTPLERRRWRQLQRQLEADECSSAGTRRAIRTIAGGTILLMFLAGAVFGGMLGVTAVAAYVLLSVLLWSFYRVVWRRMPPTDCPRDMI